LKNELLEFYVYLSNIVLYGKVEFLKELYSETGIPVSELVQVIKDGTPTLQGAWVHPQIAINLAQWASRIFIFFLKILQSLAACNPII
jgi:hypothetical protein